MSGSTCEFNSLPDGNVEQCLGDVAWKTPSGSTYCNRHKPTWTNDLKWIGPARETAAPGRIRSVAHRPAADSQWARVRQPV